jgi:hypothetical protein
MPDLDFLSNETVRCRTMTVTAKTETGKCFLHARCDEMDFITTTTETAVLLLAEQGEDLIDTALRLGLSIDGVY